MKKWRNLRNTEAGRYKLSTMVVSALLVGVLLWQGVFAMLGTTDANADAFAMLEAFGADIGDGLQNQRAAAWLDAVENPAASGGVWGQFWENAQFGAVVPAPTPTPTPAPTPTPTPGPVLPAAGAPLQMFVYNNVLWRVLHRQGSAALIITEHVFGVGAPYNAPTNIYTRLSDSLLRGTLDAWAQDNLGTLRQRALTPTRVDGDVRSSPADAWNSTENATAGRTTPGARTNSDSAVFVLSVSEANQYFGPLGVNGVTPEINAARLARDASGTARHWWLRSPGSGTVHTPASVVFENGTLTAFDSTRTDVGFRPALWISV